MMTPALSVLDLVPVRTGQTSAQAVAASLDLAQRADDLGYRRYWFAEHHNLPAGASTTPPVLIAAAAAGVLAATIAAIWLTSSDDGADRPAASPSETSTAATTPTTVQASTVAPIEKPEAVLRLVPPGYKPGACTADGGVPVGALAAVTCTRNADAGGPESGRYTLFSNKASLQAGFDQVVADSTQQICPGRIMSPGPWRHNATPEITAGTLFCGARQGQPVIAWTDDAKQLLAVVDSTGQPGLEEMFTWWSSHS